MAETLERSVDKQNICVAKRLILSEDLIPGKDSEMQRCYGCPGTPEYSLSINCPYYRREKDLQKNPFTLPTIKRK